MYTITFRLILILRSVFLLFLLIKTAKSSPPANPISCTSENRNCTVTDSIGNFSDRAICKAAKTEYPKTEQELIAIIAKATKEKRKMKVTTRYSHSTTKLVCVDGEDGLLISTNNLNRVIDVNVSAMTITVESGATLRQVIDAAAKRGLALPHSPYWWGLTVGGVLSTGAHGSTLMGRGSAVHDYVVGLTIVSPSGPKHRWALARTLNLSHSQLNAVEVSLGVLGVISKVTLKLEAMFKQSVTFVEKSDGDLADEAAKFGYKHKFGDITWYPSPHKAIYRVDDRVPTNTPGNGLFDRTLFRSTSSSLLALLRTAGTEFTGFPVIGYQNNIQSSGSCLDSPLDALATACVWDPRIKGEYYFQNGLSLKLQNIKSFIKDVQKLVKLAPKSLCVVDIYSGIVLRYLKASTAYLGKQDDGINLDITYYRSKDPMVPRLYQDVIDEIEQITVFKYKALPHWGKNRNSAFVGAIGKYKNAGKFLKVKRLYDPNGLFSSEWTDQLIGLKGEVTTVKRGCALEGLCICSKDVHCAPKKGYFCRPGKVYKSARVCTLIPE